MPGPPPKHPSTRRRRNATPELLKLPAGGRDGPAPIWPLDAEPTGGQGRLWDELWELPQAVAWERLRYGREVAQYVVWKIKAEYGDLDASKEARQLADRLGLSPLAMLRLRWEVAGDEVEAQRNRQPTTTRRLRSVDAVARAV